VPAKKVSGQFEARMTKTRGDLEFSFDLTEDHREAIRKCLDGGNLRMILQDVQLDRLNVGDLKGGYLWD
jgi:hypothetical protein